MKLNLILTINSTNEHKSTLLAVVASVKFIRDFTLFEFGLFCR